MKVSELKVWKWLLLTIGALFFFLIVYGIFQALYSIPAHWAVKSVIMFVSGLLLLLIYSAVRKKFEKERPSDLYDKSLIKNLVKGFALGACFMGITTLAIAIAGCYKIESIGCEWQKIVEALALFFIVACGEEVIFRGIVFRMVRERFNVWAALIVSALIFGFVHITNAGATVWSSVAIAVEAGLMLGAAYHYSDSLWLPIGIHWAWNFFEGNIFGFSVSGNPEMETLINPSISGPEILTGGSFGAEASVLCVILGLLVSCWLLYLARKKECQSKQKPIV